MKRKTKNKNRNPFKTLYGRANRAAGQLIKIEPMVRQKRHIEDIFLMLLAAEGSVKSMIYKHFDPIIRGHLSKRLKNLSSAQNLSEENLRFIEETRKNFSRYELNQLPTLFYHLNQFEKQLNR